MNASTKYDRIEKSSNWCWLGMFFETKYGKMQAQNKPLVKVLGMFFETKYGKIHLGPLCKSSMLGMFFETKYGKI